MPEAALPPPRREPRDIGLRFALVAAASVIALLALTAGMAAWIFPGSLRSPPLLLPVAPQPGLQSSPRSDMAELRADQLARLNGTGWVNRDKGVVHIPIEAAMRRLAAEGIPDWPVK